ncbi:MAG: hypothetical protein ACRD4S_07395 [Candidatus Acidiferrales bacterium]
MAHTYLIFDFGKDEEAAQQARHKIDGWKQGFRLGNKILLKFEREEKEEAEDESPDEHKAASGKKKFSKRGKEATGDGRVRLLVRLDFSDHEKISHQRWLDRIPDEEPFKSAEGEIIRTGDPEFDETTELFESLD